MADKRNSDQQDQPITNDSDERMRGIAGDDADAEFDDSEDLDEDEEDDEESSTF